MRTELILAVIQLFVLSENGCYGIHCFTCSSRNGSDPHCEDPFQAKTEWYTEWCKVPKRGHIGLFPAHFCVKLMGTSLSTNTRLVIRKCVVDNMENQCNRFKYDNDTYKGCVLTCSIDGCNGAGREKASFSITAAITLCTILFMTMSANYLSPSASQRGESQLSLSSQHLEEYPTSDNINNNGSKSTDTWAIRDVAPCYCLSSIQRCGGVKSQRENT